VYLLDTNVISEPRRQNPDPRVLAWLAWHTLEHAYLSVLTVGEIERDIYLLGESRRARAYREWLESELLPAFAGRILSVDGPVVRVWSLVTARAERAGRPPPAPAIDGLLAATAIAHGLTLVTCNVSDVAVLGVPALNPWEE